MTDASDIQHISSAKLNPFVSLKNLRDVQIDEKIDMQGEYLLHYIQFFERHMTSMHFNALYYVFAEEEDWRGKNSQSVSGLRRSKYSMLNKSVSITKQIPKLRNGHRKKYDKSRTMHTYNTCCFDSAFQVAAALYTDGFFQLEIDYAESSEFCKMIKRACAVNRKSNMKLSDLYVMRDKIMENIVANDKNTVRTDTGLISINCSTNVDYIIEHVWPKHLFSYTRRKWCKICKKTNVSNRCFIDYNLDRFAQKSVSIAELNEHLNHFLISEENTSMFPNQRCRSLIQIKTTLSNVIMIDLQMIVKRDTKRFSINDAPEELELCGVKFRIVALIEFIMDDACLQEKGIDAIGHYVPHIKRINDFWENYDDLLNQVKDSNRKRQMEVHTLFYIKK